MFNVLLNENHIRVPLRYSSYKPELHFNSNTCCCTSFFFKNHLLAQATAYEPKVINADAERRKKSFDSSNQHVMIVQRRLLRLKLETLETKITNIESIIDSGTVWQHSCFVYWQFPNFSTLNRVVVQTERQWMYFFLKDFPFEPKNESSFSYKTLIKQFLTFDKIELCQVFIFQKTQKKPNSKSLKFRFVSTMIWISIHSIAHARGFPAYKSSKWKTLTLHWKPKFHI